MAPQSTTFEGSVLDLDEAEATKLKILGYERLNPHLFCFPLAATVVFLGIDIWLIATDLPHQLAKHATTASALSTSLGSPLTFKVGEYVMLAIFLFLGLAHTRATGQLQRGHIVRIRFGAAAAMIL